MAKKTAIDSDQSTVVVPDEVGASLRLIGRSLAAIAVRFARPPLTTNKARIHYLQGLGFDRNDIAGILGTTPGTVSVELSVGRSVGRRRRKRSAKD